MPRGRPRKIQPIVVELDTYQWRIAEVLSKHCGIPGCGPKLHLEEASEVLDALEEMNYKRE